MEYGLIGEKLGHSFSKEVHNQIGDYEYLIHEIPREDVPAFMIAKDFKGINVTIPYKETVMPFLDYIDDAAKEIGSVNTIVNKDGVLYGYNTDFIGLKNLILSTGLDLCGKKVLILGTGGTSKTSLAVSKAMKASEIVVVSRSAANGCVSYQQAVEEHSDAAVILNATPCGMFPKLEGCPIDIDNFPKLEGVVDVIYNPLRSRLVLDAQKRGLKAQGGLLMLVQQAIAAAQFFFGKPIEQDVCDRIYRKLVGQKLNIVLAGMPGSGKTTVGKRLAQDLEMQFIDTDEEIVSRTGRTPSEIITQEGEQAFRDIEAQVCADVAGKTHCVIATGGGAILRDENVRHLKNNGEIFFIDRNLEMIVPTGDRPLTNSMDKLKATYEKRYPIYKAIADHHIVSDNDVEHTVETIKGAVR